ncbi:MAG: bifunctional DNA-formamidopyrimidine glycosylase/DNA-(apurinic or apyrimidinic site) lyase [Ktedonobacterales bacterium]|nr:bifunctional DNA-formamidopyrimidine glycosylase/DNA-(apurinic or apyrimidinic site) lyase [Ktedonobacterales bacterium]
MPELAEVEYVARQLRDAVIGAQITRVTLAWPRAIAHPAAPDFIDEVTGRTIEAIDRRGKLLLLHLSGAGILTVHRRMAGNLRLLEAAAADEPYLIATFDLADGRRLIYSDPRKFGRLAFWSAAELPGALADYGTEPLGPDFTEARLAQILMGRDRALKPLLLDQSHIAGLGNIYTDEALFRAGLHPLRHASTLTPAEIARLHEAIIAVLEIGIAHGGTTFGRHQGLYGEAGTNLDHLDIYQHEGQPCVRCGTTIQRIVVGQRGTRFCPTCQPTPDREGSPRPLSLKDAKHP